MPAARPAALSTFLILLPILFEPASASASAGPHRLGYTAYAGGIEVLSFDLLLDLPGDRYSVDLEGETQGLIGALFSWRTRSSAQGGLEASGPRPDIFRSSGEWRGEARRVVLDWDGDGGLAAIVEPAVEEEEREPVPPELLAGVLDPLSAMVGAISHAAGPCAGTLPVFDGRRRYDLVFRQAGRRVLGDSGYSAFAGEALVCEVAFEMLAGGTREDRRRARERDEPRPPAQVLLAPVIEGMPPLPVRIEAEGRLGSFILHLDRVGDAAMR
jgi:Protein of unknown function (DUF3108)